MDLRLLSFLVVSTIVGSSQAATLVYRGIPDGPVEIRRARQMLPKIVVSGRKGQVFSIVSDVYEDDKGDIGGFDISPTHYEWIWLDGRIQYKGVATRGHWMDRTKYFQPYRTNGRIFVSRLGEVWVAGAGKMRRPDGMFVPSGFGRDDKLQVQPRCDDPFGNTWAALVDPNGNEQGVAIRTFDRPDRWKQLMLPDDFPSDWCGMCVDDVGFVWVATADALVQLDARKANAVVHIIPLSKEPRITAIAPILNRQILVGFSDGTVQELGVQPGQDPRFTEVLKLAAGPVRALHEDQNGNLWIVAGRDVYRHRFADHHWREGPRMPAGTHDNIFVEHEDRFYSAGGKTYFGFPASEWVNLNHLWSYNRKEGWRREPPMLEPGKAYSGIAKQHGRIWLIGGYFRAERGTRATDTVEIFDPKRRCYALGPTYPAPRGQIVALNVGERIYAVGGEGGGVASPEMFSINAGQSAWQPEPPAPGPVTQAAGCAIGNKLYIAAGPRADCPGLFVYDTSAKKWTTVKHPAEQAPAAPLVAAWGDDVWVMGGRGKNGGEKSTWAYSTKTGKWKRGPDLPIPVSWGAAATVGEAIMIAGGAYRDEAVGNYFNSDRTFFFRPNVAR